MSVALSVPPALSVPSALSIPGMFREKFGIILNGFTFDYTTRFVRVKLNQGPSSCLSDGYVSLNPDGTYFLSTGSPISKVTISVKNLSCTGFVGGKTPCLYLTWYSDKTGSTAVGSPVALTETTVGVGATISASATVLNPANASYFVLTFNDSTNSVPDFTATPIKVTVGSITVDIN
jgi:hypothetical protein